MWIVPHRLGIFEPSHNEPYLSRGATAGRVLYRTVYMPTLSPRWWGRWKPLTKNRLWPVRVSWHQQDAWVVIQSWDAGTSRDSAAQESIGCILQIPWLSSGIRGNGYRERSFCLGLSRRWSMSCFSFRLIDRLVYFVLASFKTWAVKRPTKKKYC